MPPQRSHTIRRKGERVIFGLKVFGKGMSLEILEKKASNFLVVQ